MLSRRLLLLYIIAFFSFVSTAYADEQWQWGEPTKAAENIVQTIEESAPSVIISEILPSPEDGDEFVELYNYGTSEISLEGWRLEDVAGKKKLLTGYSIPAKNYLVIYASYSLNNTGEDAITLYSSSDEVVDTMSYEDPKKGASISRFCDMYELHFCEDEEALLTPGEENMRAAISAWVDTEGGNVSYGTKITLSSTDGSEIFYSFSGEDPINSAERYTAPLEMTDDTEVYFFAIRGGMSSPIYHHEYHVDPIPSVVINEVYVEDGIAYVEVLNTSTEAISNTSFAVGDKESPIEHFDDVGMLYPNVPEVMQVGQMPTITLYYRDISIDTVHLPATLKDRTSIVRTDTASILGNFYGEKDRYVLSVIPSIGKSNIVLTKENLDAMADKDIFAIFASLTTVDSKIQEFLFRKWLSAHYFATLKQLGEGVEWKVQGLPGAEVSLYQGEELMGKVLLNNHGEGLITLSHDVEGNPFHIVVRFQDMNSFPEPVTHVLPEVKASSVVTTSATGRDDTLPNPKVRIERILPNPEGADTHSTEWLEITSDVKVLSGLRLKVNSRVYDLPQLNVDSEAYRIYGDSIGGFLPNAGGTLQITLDGVILDTWTYASAKDGEIKERESKEMPKKVSKSNSARDSYVTSKNVKTKSKQSVSVETEEQQQDEYISLGLISTEGIALYYLTSNPGVIEQGKLEQSIALESEIQTPPEQAMALGFLLISVVLMGASPFVFSDL